VQHLRALMPLTDLRLVQRETELLTNHRRKARQPNERVNKPNQLARLFRRYGHNLWYARSGIKWSSKTLARTVALPKKRRLTIRATNTSGHSLWKPKTLRDSDWDPVGPVERRPAHMIPFWTPVRPRASRSFSICFGVSHAPARAGDRIRTQTIIAIHGAVSTFLFPKPFR